MAVTGRRTLSGNMASEKRSCKGAEFGPEERLGAAQGERVPYHFRNEGQAGSNPKNGTL